MSVAILAELDRQPEAHGELNAADLRSALAYFERLLEVRDYPAVRFVLLGGLARLLDAEAAWWRELAPALGQERTISWPAAGDVPRFSRLDARLAVALGYDDPVPTAVSVMRRARPFTSRERALLTLAGPHLSASARRMRPDRQPAPRQPPAPGLSARQREVLCLAAAGLTDAQIGRRLRVSPRTVGKHLQQIYGKLQVTNRVSATRLAQDLGLL